MAKAPKPPNEEYSLLLAAAQSEDDYGSLRTYLKPLVEAIADKYLEHPGADKETLMKEGFVPLKRAVNHYLSKFPKKETTEYKFSTYYAWWARKSIEDSLGLENTDQH